MKVIKLFTSLIVLISLISCTSESITIGTYHDLYLEQFESLTIISLGHQHASEELHEEDTQMIYDFMLKMEPLGSVLASENQKVLKTLNYMIDVNLADSLLNIESGDDYISISHQGENNEVITTIHIMDEEDMAKFNAIIEELYH
ncbi:hypothetical protein EZV73_27840 [Acidaminobacter sp. JC074]|uniref:hypothetical protein n=1 Tax=Acidaminobacter sp. JC074 TaxID=2530199 RepID=UPI001F0E2681|nr:hypothetical protein [Acidaminobacter sp. JC074]MCH4891414.1 hypothetical protein [Acidaminobacter sp. JC074]